MNRTARLLEAIEERFSGYDFAEWESAEGAPEDPPRYAMIDTCTYAWVNFGDTVEDLTFFSEGFQPIAILDLDTGEEYEPVLSWKKAGT